MTVSKARSEYNEKVSSSDNTAEQYKHTSSSILTSSFAVSCATPTTKPFIRVLMFVSSSFTSMSHAPGFSGGGTWGFRV